MCTGMQKLTMSAHKIEKFFNYYNSCSTYAIKHNFTTYAEFNGEPLKLTK